MLHHRIESKQHNVGFTLVELMITLAVAAILATAAVPSFISMIASNRVTSASNELVTALNLAKSEAVRSGQSTRLCKTDSCNAEGSWGDGWILFNDANGDGKKSDGEQIIRVHAAPDPSLAFQFNSGNSIEFRPNGRTNELGSFCFRNSHQNDNSRAVSITLVGRIQTKVVTLSDDTCTLPT
ncbi:MAG: GspH/FimT family pseudopilin [Pseudomonadota bacterium]|nr:GspH/FimT family pseudopilin [Pseudomonadota bacterium]